MVKLWPTRGGWVMQSCYSMSTLILILMVVFVVLIGAFMTMCQLLCVCELIFVKYNVGEGEKSENR